MSDDGADSADTFIRAVIRDLRRGFGFTPLFGSGMSAASGILMGQEFSGYLAYSVYIAIKEGWDFRNNGWPAYPAYSEYEKAREWVTKEYITICSRYGFRVSIDPRTQQVVKIYADSGKAHARDALVASLNTPPVPAAILSHGFQRDDENSQRLVDALRRLDPSAAPYEPLWPLVEQSPTSQARLIERAIRSLADWRLALHFLSRLVRDQRLSLPVLESPNPSVIDRFNTFITSDKKPNLGHKMLFHLERPLGIRTILTTNFDTLIEDAFSAGRMPLTKFLVSNRGELPDPFLVRAHMSIIKMHGELLETRADLSLDEEPRQEDKERFRRYFFDAEPMTCQLRSTPSHLLVAGFSANDLRIVRMVQHLLDSTRDFPEKLRPTVFWLCVSHWSVKRLIGLFPNNEYPGRVHIHRTARPDLLLHELYQKLTLSLPGGGLTYEYSHNVPPTRNNRNDGTPDFDARHYDTFDAMLKSNEPDIHDSLRDPANASDPKNARDALSRIVGHALVFDEPNMPSDNAAESRRLYYIAKASSLTEREDSLDYSRVTVRQVHHGRSSDNGRALENAPKDIVLLDCAFGALEALSISHSHFQEREGNTCLWFEMGDYLNADTFLVDILRAISLRIGRFQREHVMLHPLTRPLSAAAGNHRQLDADANDLATYLHGMCDVHHLDPSHWKIFVYAREVAGSGVGWLGSPWKKHDWQQFAAVLRAFAAVGFPIVYAIATDGRLEREKSERLKREALADSRVKTLRQDAIATGALTSTTTRELKEFDDFRTFLSRSRELAEPEAGSVLKYGCAPIVRKQCQSLSLFDSMMAYVTTRCATDEGFATFFYALSLFRQSRRPSALFHEAVQKCPERFNLFGIDNDLVRSRNAAQWVQDLTDQRIFYHKAGGHVWMHRDIRNAVRDELDVPSSNSLRDGRVPFLGKALARTHFLIGEWYFKAFCATGFILPIIESLHHRFQAALAAPYARPKNPDSEETVRTYRFMLLRSAIMETTKMMVVSHSYIKLWLANQHGFPMFMKEFAIYNDRGGANGDPRTLRQLLENARAAIHDLPDKQAKEITIQIDRLEVQVATVDCAIREEGDLNRTDRSVTSAGRVDHDRIAFVPQVTFPNVYAEDWSEQWVLSSIQSPSRFHFIAALLA